VIALVPAGLPEAATGSALVRGARNRLRTFNRDLVAEARLRLRFACGQGIVAAGRTGLGSDAVIRVCRIRDSEPARAMLRQHPAAALVLALSEDIYLSTVATAEHDLQPEQMVRVRVAVKELDTAVWLWVPDHPPAAGAQSHPGPESPAASAGSAEPAGSAGPAGIAGPAGSARPAGVGGSRGRGGGPFIGPGDLVPGDHFA